ncbi:unnamed protein product [Pleuronectes platessa]|uniref:Uncharacterized protein n=1 Tax=Pleuronectes platessa TaxID=8262 RepID=A0A9N7VV55_PLEPL|nr:unnamed protein product [Pleuronectes platessa]
MHNTQEGGAVGWRIILQLKDLQLQQSSPMLKYRRATHLLTTGSRDVFVCLSSDLQPSLTSTVPESPPPRVLSQVNGMQHAGKPDLVLGYSSLPRVTYSPTPLETLRAHTHTTTGQRSTRLAEKKQAPE